MLVLTKVRRCDGSCCKQSPRFPNRAGDDCIYHNVDDGKEATGCQLMTGEETISDDGMKSSAFPSRDAYQVYFDTCVDWPQQNSIRELGNTGDCCWQWVEE